MKKSLSSYLSELFKVFSRGDAREESFYAPQEQLIHHTLRKSRGPHQIGFIEMDNVEIGRIKIPNDHQSIMYSSKSRFIARDLNLEEEEFNDLVKCPLSGSKYFELQRQRTE